MKKTIKILGLLIIGLILILLIFFYLTREKKTASKQSAPAGQISIKNEIKLDESRAKSKIFSSAGDVMWVKSADGFLYTLTVPDDCIIMPSEVTMTPLLGNPFNSTGASSYGNGVSLSGKFTFNRPVYLTVQKGVDLPTDLTNTGARKWGRCTVGSRGYDPDLCAADNKLPFGIGIEPGKVMYYGSIENDTVRLNPTIPTGDNSTFNAMIWRAGYYVPDKINMAEAEKITDESFNGSYDYVNVSESLMHYFALGGNLDKYKDQIAKFERQKTDYPREVIKGAILGLKVKNQDVYKARFDDFWKNVNQYLDNPKASFLPLERYFAFIQQFESSPKQTLRINPLKAYASEYQLQDYKPQGSDSTSGNGSWLDRLQDYNPFNPPDENPGDNLPDYDPSKEQNGDNLPDYPGDNTPPSDDNSDGESWGDLPSEPTPDEANRAREEMRKRQEEARKREEQKLRDEISTATKHHNCATLLDLINSLARITELDAADKAALASFIKKCGESCQTLEDCEGAGDAASRNGDRDAIANINYRMIAFLETGADCSDLKKKTLETYGQNFCSGSELW